MAPGGSVTILHLSDLHFGRKHRFEQEGLGSLLSRLTADLDDYGAREGLRPHLVIASGDFAEHGKREEFDRALTFLRGLRAHLGLPARRFVIVPGNHDINWNKSRAYFEDRAGDGLPPEEPYFPKLVHYKRFFDAFYEGETGAAFTEEEPWSFFEYPDLGVVVAGLDSVIAESHREEDHLAFLGERQLRAFAARLRPWRERGYLRVAVMHHDPLRASGRSKVQQDQHDLNRLLLPELNLLLHGQAREDAPLPAPGVAVLGVGRRSERAEQGVPDILVEYQVLDVRADGIRRYVRGWTREEGARPQIPRASDPSEGEVTFIAASFESARALGTCAGTPPAEDVACIVERYRATMARCLGAPTIFDLLGVGHGAPASGLDFLRLFVPQTAVRVAPSPAHHRREAGLSFLSQNTEGESGGAVAEPPAEPEWWPDRARTVDEVVEQPRLLVIGAPGAGKSALTRWLLLKLCVAGEQLSGLPEDAVPVRIELRHFDESRRRAGEGWSMFSYVAREQLDAGGPLDEERLRALSERGRLLWLFDGLDEVVDPNRRRETAELIVSMLSVYSSCRAVVTSRTAGVDVARSALEGAAFRTYGLQPFTADQRDRFLDAWHELVFSSDPTTGARRRAHLRAAIEGAPSLQELCKSPLLCSMIAYLHREETLPQRRHLLYEKLIERMAEHWDANKGLPPRPATERFELRDKLVFLRALAWRMQGEPRTAGNTIPRGDLEDFTTAFCAERWGQPADVARRRAEVLLGQLYERGAVLAYRGADTFGFAHRAFLEYLAAAEASARYRDRRWEMEDLARVFTEHWRDVSWEEPLMLLCGLLQEAGEEGGARVVQLLQSIGAGRLAEMVVAWPQYLPFCIKGLGELPQMDRGIAGDFARAINEVLCLLLRVGAPSGDLLAPAFRRCAGRWPDVGTLVRHTVERSRVDPEVAGDLYATWVVAGGEPARMGLLLQLLARKETLPFRICSEAATFGPWSSEEVSRLLDAGRHRSDGDRIDICQALTSAGGVKWQPDAGPILELVELAEKAERGTDRVRAAWLLCCTDCALDLGWITGCLTREAQGDDPVAAREAVLRLVDLGYGEACVDELGRHARSSLSAFLALAELAVRSERGREVLGETVSYVRDLSEPGAFLKIAAACLRRGLRLFEERDVFGAWRRERDAQKRLRWISIFRGTPSAERFRIRASLELLDEAPNMGIGIWALIQDRTHRELGAPMLELWSRLMALDPPWLRLSVAARVIAVAPGGAIQARAEVIRDEALAPAAPEDLRGVAARIFFPAHPAAERVLRALASGATDEAVRALSAMMVGDLASLNELGGRTANVELREQIAKGLELYGELRSLLQVGKLRRARVCFEGRAAGVLEELNRVGNGTVFRYLPEYDGPPIAPNMPLGRTYESEDGLVPFFANLLPEGALYEQTARRLGVKRNDRFGVLLRVGADAMGAVAVLPVEPA